MNPCEVDLSDGLQSTFGIVEFEKAACHIIRYLCDDSFKVETFGFELGEGWEKKFSMETFTEIDAPLFAMMCAAGWVRCSYFPKRLFTVSEEFVLRLEEKAKKRA